MCNRVFAFPNQIKYIVIVALPGGLRSSIPALLKFDLLPISAQTPANAPVVTGSAILHSVDCHPTWYRSVAQIRHFCHMRLLLVTLHFPIRDMWLQPFAKVESAHNRVCDCHYDKDYCDDGKDSQRFPNGKVLR